jgi:cell division protein FtsL
MRPNRKAPTMLEFQTVKRIDNSRLVRHLEPERMKNYYRTVLLSGVVALFFVVYIYQHFRSIDLSFQLEELKAKRSEATALNSSLKLEIASLRNPMRIDVIARRQFGLTEPRADQVQEYQPPAGPEVVAARYVRTNRSQ